MKLFPIRLSLSPLLAACGGATPPAPDLLSQVQQRGALITSAGTNYAPQSVLKAGGARPAGSRCPAGTLTTGELEGFDIDVAAELARRLGVEICFATPTWDLVTAGSWGGRWDISVGSMTITPARLKVLSFTTPYYYAWRTPLPPLPPPDHHAHTSALESTRAQLIAHPPSLCSRLAIRPHHAPETAL